MRYLFFYILLIITSSSATGQIEEKQIQKSDTVKMIAPMLHLELLKDQKLKANFDKKMLGPLQNAMFKSQMQLQLEAIIDNPDEDTEDDFRVYVDPSRKYDSRLEICELGAFNIEHQYILKNSLSVFGVTVTESLLDIDDEHYQLDDTRIFGEVYGLCKEEPYWDQPLGSLGTAFLIRPDVLLTAYHNLEYASLEDYRFVIGFEQDCQSAGFNTMILKSEVYRAIGLITEEELVPFDVALIQLDRPVEGRPSLELDISTSLNVKDRVYAMGHPAGLPLKLTINASIRELNSIYAYTTLDTYQGNSGSPVFARDSHKVIGVLTEGMADFVNNGNCIKSNLCLGTECKGEKVLLMNALGSLLADLPYGEQ